MAGKLIIPILLFYLVSNLISASKLRKVYYRFLTNEQLTRVPEFFTGREFTGSQLFYRTSNKKEGLYFFVPLNAQVDKIPDQVKVILSVIQSGEKKVEDFEFQISEISKTKKELLLGITGDDWNSKNVKPIAWKLVFEDLNNKMIFYKKSFLWDHE